MDTKVYGPWLYLLLHTMMLLLIVPYNNQIEVIDCEMELQFVMQNEEVM